MFSFRNYASGSKIKLVVTLIILTVALLGKARENFDYEFNSYTNNATLTKPEINWTTNTPETTPSAQLDTYTVLSITDGDTLRILYDGKSTPLRLIGIDAPETNHPTKSKQCFGKEASEALKNLLANKTVTIEKDVSNVDNFDRLLRYVWLDGEFVNEYMVKNGYAFSVEYKPDTKHKERLDAAEGYAKANKLGLWAANTCDGIVEINI